MNWNSKHKDEDKDKFKNRLCNRINNFTSNIPTSKYPDLTKIYDACLEQLGYSKTNGVIKLGELLDVAVHYDIPKDLMLKLLKEATTYIRAAEINQREMALEEYRKNNTPLLPSRLHSFFACTEEGVEFWKNLINDTSADIYRIVAYNEPFISSDDLLPRETDTYEKMVNDSYRYFHPKAADLNTPRDEYLLQGPVRILEKVGEIKRANRMN